MTEQFAWILSAFWLVGAVVLVLRVRLPDPLPSGAASGPLVSVIVPARNEARSIVACLESICAAQYDAFEVVVVDDQSDDGTGALARSVLPGRARRVMVLDGEALPQGWLGKPWACHQGARAAEGEILLFTDADTLHEPDLLGRTVGALEAGADAVTVAGDQAMESFWERLVQPQVFFRMSQVFSNVGDGFDRGRWKTAIANGQYLAFTRSSYRRLGGHEAVRAEVAEDLRLAQLLVRDGYELRFHDARGSLSTRMYRSLGELISGWSKNMARGARLVGGRWGAVILGIADLILSPLLWLVPPVLLIMAALGALSGPLVIWAVAATAINCGLWALVTAFMGVPAWYGLLHPLGASAVWVILLRSLIRGSRVEWKGREYRVEPPA
ncbi:MAG: glycosyltransferase [Gemmatimonadota bacterium]|nr:glycosyltransferase [Gemmatimonadota bacterium]